MDTTRSIKINFEGDSRDVALQLPATLGGLQAAVASTFSADLPPRSEGGTAEYDLRFTYKDPEGDDIVFDKDSELSLALRVCPKPEVLAITKAKQDVSGAPKNDNDPDKIYRVATRNLRQHHGVPHMTPDKLIKTLALLKMGPRRLVCKGLAPRKLLPAAFKEQHMSFRFKETNEDLEKIACAEMEMMVVETDMAGSGDKQIGGHADIIDGKSSQQQPKMPLRAALLAADVRLPPKEVRPFLSALGVRPRRFVMLGLIDAKDLPRGPHGSGPHGGKLCGPRGRGADGRGPGGRGAGGRGPGGHGADGRGPGGRGADGRGPGGPGADGWGPGGPGAVGRGPGGRGGGGRGPGGHGPGGRGLGLELCARARRHGRVQAGTEVPPHPPVVAQT